MFNYTRLLKISFFLVIYSSFNKVSYAQDPRVSQYNAIPLLINPSQTGEFDGRVRILGLYSRVDNDVAYNTFYNGSVDWRFGKRGLWGLGVNYLQSGSPNIPLSGKYAGVSAARGFFIDKYKFQEVRLGFQASYIKGKVDESKGPYDKLIDLRAFRYWLPADATGKFTGTSSYINYSVGAKYKLTLDRLKLESGFSAYNTTNPDYNIMYNGKMLKRYRVTALSSIYYQPDPKNALKLEHFSWKEGIYLREYKPARDSGTGIHETIYSLTYYRYLKNKSFNFGMYSRSWQAVYGLLGVNLNQRVGVNVSYEFPILKKYYNVSHFELSLSLYPFGKKKKPEEQRDRELTQQMQAILPFNTSFCLPCLGNSTVNISIPDSLKNRSIPCDSLAENPLTALPPDTSKLALISKVPARVPFSYKDTIYYDLDKYYIRTDAVATLNKISSMMKNNSSLALHIKSHTDLRASVPYNQILSRNRARSATDYLSRTGIDSLRITRSWYSELSPLNNCETCNDVLQQKNRRSELYLEGFEYKDKESFLFGSAKLSREQFMEQIKSFMNLTVPELLSDPVGNRKYLTIKLAVSHPDEVDNFGFLRGLNPNVFSEKDKNGFSSYYFGVFNEEITASTMIRKLKELGFGTATSQTIAKPK